MKLGSLFSGIGGLEMGVEAALGATTIWQCESDPYAQKVLKRHWGVHIYEDIRHIDESTEKPDILVGGFPCQDISVAGKGAGLDGEKSGLWSEFARCIRILQPGLVIAENVPALLGRGMGRVLSDLYSCGYNAWWDCIPASALGAPHKRDRVFIVAWPQHGGDVADALCRRGPGDHVQAGGNASGGRGEEMADADRARCKKQRQQVPETEEHKAAECRGWWEAEPDVGRVVDGVRFRTHRLRCLGNAVVPQVAYAVGLVAKELICTQKDLMTP